MLLATRAARAHNGPPFPIIESQQVGPFVVSLWTHPDVGVPSLFFVIVNPRPGASLPPDLKVRIGLQPEDGRLPERIYETKRDPVKDHVQFDNTEAAFDRDEFWKVRLILESSLGGAETFSRVEATPVGLGKWDLLFYLSPFLLLAGLWFRGISRVRRGARARPPSTGGAGGLKPPASSPPGERRS
jgi:hypothetical protein